LKEFNDNISKIKKKIVYASTKRNKIFCTGKKINNNIFSNTRAKLYNQLEVENNKIDKYKNNNREIYQDQEQDQE